MGTREFLRPRFVPSAVGQESAAPQDDAAFIALLADHHRRDSETVALPQAAAIRCPDRTDSHCVCHGRRSGYEPR